MTMSDIIDDIAQYMRMRQKTGQRCYHLLLVCEQDMHCTAKGYLALASLMKEKYFSTILTIGFEGALESALIDLEVHSPKYKKLVIGQDPDEYIVDALDDEGAAICIIELDHLKHQEPEAEEELVTIYPTSAIQTGLQRYLNQEIVIVGSIEYEHDLLAAFLPHKENTIYYVLPAEAALQDRLSTALGQQGKQPIFIPEPYNTFDAFFEALASRLISDNSHTRQKITAKTIPLVPEPNPQPSPPRQSSSRRQKLKADLVLVTVTPVETEAILAHVSKKRKVSIGNRAYHDLDIIGGAKTFLVQLPHMGSGGSGGSLKTVEAAILALSPWAVIMVGIAFGFDPANQRIGDILISQQIQDYDLERVGSGPSKYPRGNRVSASASLLSNFITSQYYIFEDWPNPPQIYAGLILSGSKLVDDEDFRNQLHMIAPNAVGGEMEGVGLYEAALNKGVEWLLVKAISDWADGKKHVHKKEYQQLAAEHAARFTIKAIELGGFTRPSRR
jgi:nucleoside phosphorylase